MSCAAGLYKEQKFMSFKQKKFLDNPYLDSIKSKVTSCILNDEKKYEVILENTIFYPHLSGGQPKDEGTVNGIEVLNVYEQDENIIHILPEAVYGEVEQNINFEKRFDHMQQHSGQHILSCAFSNLYNAKTIGFHLSGEYTTIDLDIAEFDNDKIKNIEEYCNKIIYDNIKIESRILSHDEALKTGLRKQPVDDETIRIIRIGDKDNVACCGTHVNYTGEIGIIKVIKYEKYKSGTRVEFLCGKRALTDYINKNNDIQILSNAFSCHTSMVAENIFKFKNESGLLVKKISMLQDEINQYEAESFIQSAICVNGINYSLNMLKERDIKDLRFIVSKITKNNNYFCAFVVNNNDSCSIIIGQSANLNIDIKDIYLKCSDIIEAKGGGNSKMIQGTGKKVEAIDECFNMLKNYFGI